MAYFKADHRLSKLSRRRFLKGTSAIGGGLTLFWPTSFETVCGRGGFRQAFDLGFAHGLRSTARTGVALS